MGITTVAGVPVQSWHTASCHCGSIELRLHLPEGIVDPRRCDCSMCRRRGAIAASVSQDGLQIVRGHAHLRRYQFNTHVAEHYFCGLCGIYTHHRRRSNPHQYGYNVACLEGINPFALGEVPVNDGVNHPADRTG
ncbi:GFA family protein [Stenotrophomonas sp. 24(2023)]|uniref:GFA family protein n=1 Tax=Stenotrophomonas sp. 24(2023) TaxID=3068324 RepID=UPI0027E163C8|nr:GFA family protein [Stenotrophomonas sp. 24(2023)]WMJ68091.1 GFA family protein [Stenotrophomonas sp. 24(2023)]